MEELSVTQEDICSCVTGIMAGFDDELFSKTQEELEGYWFFKYDPALRLDHTLYNLYDMLELYSSFCRRWEEHHNGHVCVVERVRDRYIMPKIRTFMKEMASQQKSSFVAKLETPSNAEQD